MKRITFFVALFFAVCLGSVANAGGHGVYTAHPRSLVPIHQARVHVHRPVVVHPIVVHQPRVHVHQRVVVRQPVVVHQPAIVHRYHAPLHSNVHSHRVVAPVSGYSHQLRQHHVGRHGGVHFSNPYVNVRVGW